MPAAPPGNYLTAADHQNSASTSHNSEIARLLEQGLRQGGKLSLEVATPREKAQNSWRSWQWLQTPKTVADAVEQIQACAQAHPQSFIRLIAYNPQTQQRLLQEVIIRP